MKSIGQHSTAVICALAFMVGTAARAESTFSIIEPSGESFSWKVERLPASTTQPAATIYSVYERATQTYHPATNPTEIADLEARTIRAEKQSAEIWAESRLTSEQRTHRAVNEALAAMSKNPKPPPRSLFGQVIDMLRGILFILSLLLVVAAVSVRIVRWVRSRGGN